MISFIRLRRDTLVKFVFVSGSAVLVNLISLHVLIQDLGFNSSLGENIANILSLEISIIYNFVLSRAITWNDRPKVHGLQLFVQLVKFQGAIGITTVMRIGLFALLQFAGIGYILNASIGIAIAAFFNFIAYDRIVFKEGT